MKEVGMYMSAELVRLRMEELRRESDRDRIAAEARADEAGGPGHLRLAVAGALGRLSTAAASAEIRLLHEEGSR